MDVVKLNSTDFLGAEAIEGYSSMIWTERHLEPGEFELRTPKINETLALLPEDSLITLLDTDEVMMVQSHELERADDGSVNLLTKGYSFDGFLENRFIAGNPGEQRPMAQDNTYSEAAAVLIWNYFVNTTTQDVTYSTVRGKDPKDVIPNLVVTSAVSHGGPEPGGRYRRYLTPGPADKVIKDFLGFSNMGIRTIRPSTTGNQGGIVISVSASGVISVTQPANIPQLRIEVYTGKNRTTSQVTNSPVELMYSKGHLVSDSYLLSSKGHKTMAEINAQTEPGFGGYGTFGYEDDTSFAKSGLARKMIFLDGGRKGDNMTTEQHVTAMVQQAELELKKHRRTRAISTEVSPNIPYKYKTHYYLGDLVSVVGDYGFKQDLVVGEYVRTEDREGDRGFPTLTLPV